MRPRAGPTDGGRAGVVLLQMGGPGSLDEVEPFLRRILSDAEIIRLPHGLRRFQPVLGAVGALTRGRTVRPMYAAIGGRSPIAPTTRVLAARVAGILQEVGARIPVTVAMRYSSPRATEAVATLRSEAVERVVLLPLYPHYSPSTVGSSVNDFRAASRGASWEGATTLVPEWGLHPAYQSLLSCWVQSTLDRARQEWEGPWHLLFSAHGLPKRYVTAGDAYPDRVRAASEAVAARVRGHHAWHLAFQSRMGSVEWTRPYTGEALKTMGTDGVRSLVTVPMGFVSDHLETLYEIDILYRDIARKAGIQRFHRVPAFNEHPDFARFLANLVLETLEEDEPGS